MSEGSTAAGIGISGLCMLWGIVTQCLNWAGVIQWPWYAIWGPILFMVAIWIIVFIVVLIFALIIRR